MLDKMRGISRPVIWIVAIVFIGGMATMGISSVFQEKPYVGQIAGEKIKYDEYYKLLQNTYTNYMQDPANQGKEIDDAMYRRLNDQTWDQLVQRIILEKQISKFDIQVSPKEVATKMINEPPEMITSYEAFQTEGQFDKSKYLQALQNPQIDWNWLSNYYEQLLQYEKLRSFVNADVIITEQMVMEDFIKKVQKRDKSIVSFDFERVVTAINRAMKASGEGSEAEARMVAHKVVADLVRISKKFKNFLPTVEGIQDTVEKELMLSEYINTAKNYILYRQERTKIREQNAMVPDEVKTKIAESSKYFKTSYQEFIFYQFYSRWRDELGRRETWVEAIDRFMDFMKENMGSKLTGAEYEEVREAILNQEICPSMRLLWSAG